MVLSRGFSSTRIQPSLISQRRSSTFLLSSTKAKYEEGDDNSFKEYSSSLTPKQEQDQLNYELSELTKVPIWKRIARKTLRGVTRVASKVTGSSEVSSPGTLILVRGGESEFSKNFTFTGWADPDLIEDGKLQMEHCSRLLYESGYADIIDVVYTSRLKRSIKSAWILVQEISAPFLPMYKSWRLNERHYGSLTGLCKKEAAKTLGADVVQAW